MSRKTCLLLGLMGLFQICTAQQPIQLLRPVNFSQVVITDNFWKAKIDKVATTTLATCIYQTEIATPRIRNFEKVARKKGEKHEGIYYDDSDVYKALEAIAYALKNHRDSALEKKADEWIDKIGAAQLPDGYLNTYFTLNGLDKRWTDIEKHEDYCAGHLIEAAVAYFNATGKRRLLDVSIRLANHIDSTFRLANKPWFSGHEEIELALMKLYALTQNDRYLKLADWYLQQRGKGYYKYGKNWIKPDYWQDQLPVKEQCRITGHAVRAMYLYSGAADVAAATGDQLYIDAMKKVWDDVVHRNLYLTGGIGSSGNNEGFSADYDLPNESAYCETCASVGMVLWNQRMNMLTGESKYIDVLEKSLYNAALDGLSLSGDRFFYDNPLASDGQHQRRAWFGTACCPANIARLITSLGNYIYATSSDGLWVNLYVSSSTNVNLSGSNTAVQLSTNYPWDGRIKIVLSPQKKAKFALHLRVPGWLNQAADGELYQYSGEKGNETAPTVLVNGTITAQRCENGYLIIEREWKKDDVVELNLPMEVRTVVSSGQVKADADRVAIQRGPIVYCVEGADNKGQVWDILFNGDVRFEQSLYKVGEEPVIAIRANLPVITPSPDGKSITTASKNIIFIPYYSWANRGPNPMQVWLPTKIREIKINYASSNENGGNY